MDINIGDFDGTKVIRLNGALDARSGAALRTRLSELIAAGASRFVVDASQLRFVDSMGLGTLIYLRRCARQAKGDVRIAGAGPELLDVLEICGLAKVFELLPTVEAALARFTATPAA